MSATPLPSADVLCPHCKKKLDRLVFGPKVDADYRRLQPVGCGHCHALIHMIELPMPLGGR